jgi:hypothetical protein
MREKEMRLTLRTLLAYLDDTLEPAETKQIGQKVAESDTAQELIARIKQVTRRRRLTTPPDAVPGAKFDANVVAEYLDNELNPEMLAEVEKLCLESDVHLAEIAACHQILTLVVGEPLQVPPTAKERMYALAGGRKVKATPMKQAAETEAPEDDFPLSGTKSWLVWAVPAAVVLLFGALVLALWPMFAPAPPRDPNKDRVASADKTDGKPADKDHAGERDAVKDSDKPGRDAGAGDKDKDKPTDKDKPADKDKPGADKDKPIADKPGDKDKVAGADKDKGTLEPAGKPPEHPSTEVQEVGKFISKDNVLVRRVQEGKTWQRVKPESRISTGQPLVSLPGYTSELRLDSGVSLLLWGNVPEFLEAPILESAVVLHHNPKFDLELTLDRGRVYITNRKESGKAMVRLRFQKEIWDLTLQEPGTEIVVEFLKQYTRGIDYHNGEEPMMELYLCVKKGRAGLKADYDEFPNLEAPPSGQALFAWDNKLRGRRGPIGLDKPLPIFEKTVATTKPAQDARAALRDLSVGLAQSEVDTASLYRFVEDQNPSRRFLGVLCLGAVDAVSALFDCLASEDENRFDVRQAAIFTLRKWIGRGADQDKKLYDREKRTGMLVTEKKYRQIEAETILDLLHDFSEDLTKKPETYAFLIDSLRNEKLAIRELAVWHLMRLAPWVKVNYNPAGGPEQRQAAYEMWKKVIPDGKLPPPPPPPPPGKP